MSNVIMCSECKKCDGDRCNYFDNDSDRESTIACILFEPKQPTVFHQITASPEVLAPRLVFCAEYKTIKPMYLEGKGGIIVGEVWKSTVIAGASFKTEQEAIAATLEKLKEVGE